MKKPFTFYRKLLFIVLLLATLTFSQTVTPYKVYAKVSCDELNELNTSLDNLAEALVDAEIGVNSPLDKALDELLNALFAFADTEQDASLDIALTNMDNAWNDMQQDAFKESLDQVIAEIDGIMSEECR
ncbi:MAG: hypothetical protein HQK84_09725 [Nitrospinae bacterium]|nr:hypothetical protein [Nitrospinota bacterium]